MVEFVDVDVPVVEDETAPDIDELPLSDQAVMSKPTR
jgi:hypothetical protein